MCVASLEGYPFVTQYQYLIKSVVVCLLPDIQLIVSYQTHSGTAVGLVIDFLHESSGVTVLDWWLVCQYNEG